MLFPVKGFHALPFKASSADDSLFDDLAAMHAERLGVRADPMAGQLSDTFLINKDAETATLLGVVLKSPGEGDLPPRSPKEFDLSPRAFAVPGEAITVWKEFGRWVFAFHRNGKLLYSQATSSSSEAPDAGVLKEIHLALGQMAIQGLPVKPEVVQVWPPDGPTGSAGELSDGFSVPVRVSARPDPVLPQPRSKLLPADVRAARRVAKERQQKFAIAGVLGLAYLGLAAWLGYGLWKDSRQVKKLQKEADSIASAEDRADYEAHLEKWSELGSIVDVNRSPVEILSRAAKAIPANSRLRLKIAEIGPKEIKLTGEAPQAQPISQFNLNLSNSMREFEWQNPPPTNSNTGWSFLYTGTRPEGTETP